MSNVTVASLQRITPLRLHMLLKQQQQQLQDTNTALRATKSIAVVDVRDSDYLGGHIRDCVHAPSSKLDWKLPELIRTLADKDVVVFHCMLSQQRGPAAGLRYLRERERERERAQSKSVDKDGERAEQQQPPPSINEDSDTCSEQVVYVLDGGFQKWQEQYGEDETVTEGYMKDLWQDGYMD